MYINKKYFYRVSVCDVYDTPEVQDICDEISFDFEKLKDAQDFSIICMKNNPFCIARIEALDKQKYKQIF